MKKLTGLSLFSLACLMAAIVPLIGTNKGMNDADAPFPGWPAVFEGRPVRETELGEMEKAFERDFPGRMGRFTDGSRSIVLRWVTAPTHRVHSGADCLRSFGWQVEPGDLWRDSEGALWSTWDVSKQGRRMRIREQCRDGQGGRWADVSAWFWAATLGRTDGPWWVITVGEARSD
jgi:hypothetical protein